MLLKRLELQGLKSFADKTVLDLRHNITAIVGPNGSGKSTLAYTIAGHPAYKVISNKDQVISLDGEDLGDKTPDERARKGIIMAFQNPVAVSGVTVRELLLSSLRAKGEKVSALELKKKIKETAEELGMESSLLTRGINEGFSGGEKKKLEILQMKLLSPALLILDEVDSGLDIDALKTIAMTVHKEIKKRRMSALVITHYQRLLKFLVPDRVVIMKKGEIVDKGGADLVERLEKEGYKAYE